MTRADSQMVRIAGFAAFALVCGEVGVGCSRDDSMGANAKQDASRDGSGLGGAGGGETDSLDASVPLESFACDPFAPTPRPIALGEILAIGKAADGVIYVVDQSNGTQRVFVSSNGVLVRQRTAGGGSSSNPDGSRSYTVIVPGSSVAVAAGDPSFTLAIEMDSQGKTRMGVAPGTVLKDKPLIIGEQGEELTVLQASDITGMRIQNLPGDVHLEYAATLPDGQLLVVTRPTDDWTLSDFRVFLGPPTAVAERKVSNVQRFKDGGSTTIAFDEGGVSAVAKFPVSLLEGPGPATLESDGTSTPLTLLSAQPAGASYRCLADSCAVAADRAGPYPLTFVFQNSGSSSVFFWDTGCDGYAVSISSCAGQYADELAPTYACACSCSDPSCKSNPVCGPCRESQAVEVRPGEQVTMDWQAETIESVAQAGPPAYTCAKHSVLPAAKYRIVLSVASSAASANPVAAVTPRLVRTDFTLPAPGNQVTVELAQ